MLVACGALIMCIRMHMSCVTLAVVFHSLQPYDTSYTIMLPALNTLRCGCTIDATVKVIIEWLQLELFYIAWKLNEIVQTTTSARK